MPEPAGVELQVEVRWCPDCDADRTVQIVQLAGDPEPVAVCAECGAGIGAWISPEFFAAGSSGPAGSRSGARSGVGRHARGAA